MLVILLMIFIILVGLNFGVLLIWIAISCTTMPLIQWYVRRKDVVAARIKALEDEKPNREGSV